MNCGDGLDNQGKSLDIFIPIFRKGGILYVQEERKVVVSLVGFFYPVPHSTHFVSACFSSCIIALISWRYAPMKAAIDMSRARISTHLSRR